MGSLPRPGPAELAKAMQAEVLQCVRAGVIPPNVGSFDELHESCDASGLGGTESLLERPDAVIGRQAALDHMCDLMNAAIPLVDQWLRAGGMRAVTQPTSDIFQNSQHAH